ncbi:hypothetical protein LTR20_007950 [Exophiala xenobiotica]|nr:hypothetical protein LTR93_007564 [Exophiala xenobiotica]KAK5381972.1 hypothetical protein LTS13_002634 [Exophiala xenobiotica]KAK5394446.1 hypothetical protein LTR79_007896 [Exophiala xenobiotica]KAK5423585.1 hypothetical protein LTR90_000929 [Exophiala xenobiotica]KAK5459278.1 hypothetical protein LTR20_007950 [Exophiala xenobiotica]
MESLPQLPATRRLVTGHNDEGKAIFKSDETIHPVNPLGKETFERNQDATASPLGVTLIHRTRGYPVKVQGGEEELTPDNVRRGQGEPGIVCQIVDLPPSSKGSAGYLHRNQSLDYGVVLKGSMQIILDDGMETTLNEGDVYVQKATLHSWKNVTADYCRFMTVVIPSEAVKVEATGELLEVTKIPALSD